jgi:hypothetical protein
VAGRYKLTRAFDPKIEQRAPVAQYDKTVMRPQQSLTLQRGKYALRRSRQLCEDYPIMVYTCQNK